MKRRWRAALLAVAAAATATVLPPARVPTTGASTVALDVFAQPATMDLLTAERHEQTVELTHRRSLDGGDSWSGPHAVNRGGKPVAGAHRGMDPQIAAIGDALVTMWTTPGTDAWGDGPLATSISRDGGRTWTPGPNPADDGSAHGHSFLELSADGQGRLYAFWLDSRDGGQGLRTAVSADHGQTWSANTSIDTRTCECCWNKALPTDPESMLLLYRDRDPRDMALGATTDRGRTWTRRATVGAFNWGFNGCPHVGGGLAETSAGAQRYLHAVVWTGAEGREGLHALRSGDAGQHWSDPQRIGSIHARHADLAANGPEIVAVWDEGQPGQTTIQVSRSTDHGATWSAPSVLSTARQASHPLAVSSRGRVVAFWTEQLASGALGWRQAIVTDAGRSHSTRAVAGASR